MGPRKRPRPNIQSNPNPPTQNGPAELEVPAIPNDASNQVDPQLHRPTTARKEDGDTLPNKPSQSSLWPGGSWPRLSKSTAVTQVAKESITAAAGVASAGISTHTIQNPRFPLPRNTRIPVSESNNHSDGSSQVAASQPVEPPSIPHQPSRVSNKVDSDQRQHDHGTINSPEASTAAEGARITDRPLHRSSKSTWFSWLSSNPIEPSSDAELGQEQTAPVSDKDQTARTQAMASETSHSRGQLSTATEQLEHPPSGLHHSPKGTGSQSWLSLWGAPGTSRQQTSSRIAAGNADDSSLGPELSGDNIGVNEQKLNISHSKALSETSQQSTSSGWAFWSRDSGMKRLPQNCGELALANSPSQSKPEDDVLDCLNGVPAKVRKRQRPQSLDSMNDGGRQQPLVIEPGSAEISRTTSPANRQRVIEGKKLDQNQRLNQLLPPFADTHISFARPSMVQQLNRWLPFAADSYDQTRLKLDSKPLRVKKAVIIGVHGYFPAPLVRSFLGQPTGTSIRFANSAANALSKWTEQTGYSCDIEKVALEGEGKIGERVEVLWNLLLNWVHKIREADFVFVACHSQGCPVALILLAKLIGFGCVSSARVGVCAMAGINQGPFRDYRTRWIGATALELFDFAQQDSRVSQDYNQALDVVLEFGVKILYVGSIDDQLVSLESSTFSRLSHPNIYRAVFVDGRVHAPDFLTHLVGFLLKLRNLGLSDHDMIRELSSPLAGSLYSGEGHSRIYEDEAVYSLAIQHALETSRLTGVQKSMQLDSKDSNQNPYILPFAMRGVLEESHVKSELHGEVESLIRQFDDWKPSSKVLKDVKFRLEGVRSR